MAGSAIIGHLRAILSLDTADFEQASVRVSQAAKGWTKDLRSMGSQATAIGSSMSTMLTLPILGVGYAAVEAGAKVEQTLNQVAAVTNASAEDMKKLSDAAAEWGAKTKFSNAEAAEAMLELGKAGFDANATIAALPSTLQLATAANMGLGEAAQLTANVMNTFGLAASDLAHSNDIMAEAANRSTIDVGDLRESLKFVGPVARIAGVSLADVAAASAVLGQNGIKAEMAGTGLRGMMAELLSPGKALAGMLGDLGFAQELNAGKTVDWTQMLDVLHAKFGEGKDTADKYAGWVMEAFGKRAGPAVIAMAQEGGAAIKQLSGELDAASGSAGRMSDAFMKGLPGAMEVAKGSMETMFASIMTTFGPTLEQLLKGVSAVATFIGSTLVPAFNSMPEPIKMASVVLLGLVAAAGPVIFVLGQVLTGLSTITAAFTTTGIATTALAGVMPVLAGAVAFILSPIGLLLAAIVGLGLAWYKWGDDVKAVVSAAYTAVKEWLWDKLEPVLTPIIGLLDSIGKMFEAFGMLVGAVVEKVYTATQSWLGEKLVAVFNGLMAAVKFVVDTIGAVLGKIPDALLPLLGPIGLVVLAFRKWDEISRIAQAVYTLVKTWLLDKFTEIVNGVKAKVDAVTGFFKDMYEKVVGGSYVPDMIAGIKTEFGKLEGSMVAPVQDAVTKVKSHFEGMLSDVTSRIDAFGSSLEGMITSHIGGPLGKGMAGIAGQLIGSVSSILTGGLSSLFAMAMPFVMEGMKKLGEAVWNGIKAIGSAIGGLFKGEGAKTNDTRDSWMDRLGGLEGAHGLIAQHGNDPELMAAFERAYFAGNRDDFGEGAAAFEARLLELNIPKFGRGGYVDTPTLAWVGDKGGEYMVPEAAMLDPQAFGNGRPQTVIFEMDGRQFARAIIPPFAEEVKRLQLTR